MIKLNYEKKDEEEEKNRNCKYQNEGNKIEDIKQFYDNLLVSQSDIYDLKVST